MDSTKKQSVRTVLSFAVLVFKVIWVYIETIVNFFRPAPRKSIIGQNVLITGAGHGLGQDLALKFAELGANVVLVDINESNNKNVQQLVQKKFPSIKVLSLSVDVRDESNIAKMADIVKSKLGDVDILVNNAGIVQCLPFEDLTPALVERTFQVNVLAHIWTVRHFLPAMLKNGRGHIVATASIAGLIGAKYLTDYCASKFAIVGLMESLEKEIHDNGANRNVHFTTACPSCMSTGMFQTFTTRFDWLLPVLNSEQVAGVIVDSVLRNKQLVVIPPIALLFHRLSSIVPRKANDLVQNYLEYGVKPHIK